MSVAWVAGNIRARALVQRRARGITRQAATQRNLADAVRVLARTPYGHDVRPGQDLLVAQHAVAATLLWHLRVLAGWLPARGMAALRVLVGWFEIANVDALLFGGPVFEMGGLATAWPTLRNTSDLRVALTTSRWGDPGGNDPRSVQLGMRISWARRVAAVSPSARPWAAGALALLVARERFLEGRAVPAPSADLIGKDSARATDLAELSRRLPADAAWALRDVGGEHDLWAAEERWWARVERDGVDLLSGGGYGPAPVLGAVALLAADARQARAALELAVRGGSAEECDALAR
ncbi:hypothetical protein [Actinoallomurus sp. NPDC050550]|uniref:hypothetical protein n=1 Tax=Actinoallomurus sp. NPDC050550 TaxID=3154937 RepID=UPI0033F71D37